MKKQEILNFKKHHGRDDLAGEHRFGDLGQGALAIIFLAVWIADSFIFNFTDFAAKYIPFYIRLTAGFLILIVSGYLAGTGMYIVFKEVRREAVVIRKGVFGIVRHPIYLSAILLFLGLLVFTLSLAALGVWLVIIAFYHYIARYEEKLLLRRFGDHYAEYMKEVPMWLPRIL
jgi:protein-S-isoprenylcysteine O-methyltransferase Ste14